MGTSVFATLARTSFVCEVKMMVRGFGMNEHENLAKILKQIQGKFMLSYNDCEVIRDLYKDFKFKELKVNYSLNAKYRSVKSELLIMNF